MKVTEKTRDVVHIPKGVVFRVVDTKSSHEYEGFFMMCGGHRADMVTVVNLETGKVTDWGDRNVKVIEYPEASMVLEGK